MKKLLFIILVLLTCLSAQEAETAESTDLELNQGIGLAGGMISGSGFSYRHFFNQKNGVQVTFGVMKLGFGEYEDDVWPSDGHTERYNSSDWVPDTTEIFTNNWSDSNELWGNIGITYYRIMHESKRSQFFLMGGGSVYFASDEQITQDYKYTIHSDSTYSYGPVGDSSKETVTDFLYSVGIGIGLEYRLTDNIRLHAGLPLVVTSEETITMFVPQIGLHYYF